MSFLKNRLNLFEQRIGNDMYFSKIILFRENEMFILRCIFQNRYFSENKTSQAWKLFGQK